GFFFSKVAIPPTENGFILPVFVLVPSGKIKADQFFIFILLASFKISAMDCLASFLSILAAPPCTRLNDMLGIPAWANSILEINFPWNLRRKYIRGGMSNVLR